MAEQKQQFPQQKQTPPGSEAAMKPQPRSKDESVPAAGKLKGKVAIITGADSGIGRAVAILFAREGARVTIAYKSEHDDAKETKRLVEEEGGKAILIAGDVGDEDHCRNIVETTVREFGGLDILVNNAAEQRTQESIENITEEQLVRTFRTNIFAMFFMVKAALKHLKTGSAIVNTTSITAYKGSSKLLDYSSTKGAIVTFTRSLSENLVERGIRVNAVAPGPIWTPLIPSTMPEEEVKTFGSYTPMKRAGQPEEVAPAFLFLASPEASYISGQVIHVNGGVVVNG